jgi:hypothetical protein
MQESVPLQNAPSLQGEPFGSGRLQVLVVSLHDSAQFASPSGPGHGLPLCAAQAPPLQVSTPVQNSPSVQGVPFGSAPVQVSPVSSHDSEQLSSPSGPRQGLPRWTEQLPALQVSEPLQNTPSPHVEPLGSVAVQLSAASLHDSAQLASPSGPGQGLPACVEQIPLLQVSAPLQNAASLHAEPLGSAAVQVSVGSLHDSAQLASPSGPGHGLPLCVAQTPPLHVSLPLQYSPSVHAEPFGSPSVQASAASLHVSEQLPSPSGPGHGLPAWVVQLPPLQVSTPLQNRPSLQATPFGSASVQASADSSQDSEQLPSPSAPGHGLPPWVVQLPPLQASAPLQNRPSAQAAPFGSASVQLSAASLHDSAQFASPSGPEHGLPLWVAQLALLHVSGPLQ